MMMKIISNEEANALAAYEPIESEFRTQAYKKWRNVKAGISMYGPRWRHMEPDAGIMTLTRKTYMGIEDMDRIHDYFPLDKVESPTQLSSYVPGKHHDQVAELSIFRRASMRLRKSFRNRCACS